MGVSEQGDVLTQPGATPAQLNRTNSRAGGANHGFWETVLRNKSEGKLRKLLNGWLQESLVPADVPADAPRPGSMTQMARSGGSVKHIDRVQMMTREHSAPEDIAIGPAYVKHQAYAAYDKYPAAYPEYHKYEAEGAPRTNSPNDVMAPLHGMPHSTSPSTSGAPPPPDPSGSTGEASAAAPTGLPDIGETPSTASVFRGEPAAARLEPRRPTDAAGSSSGGAAPGSSGGGVPAGAAVAGAAVASAAAASSLAPTTAAAAAGSSSAVPDAPALWPAADAPPAITCTECQVRIDGPIFMLNDHAYCCQRHRLLAYHKFERGQINARCATASASAPANCTYGLRATYQAWI